MNIRVGFAIIIAFMAVGLVQVEGDYASCQLLCGEFMEPLPPLPPAIADEIEGPEGRGLNFGKYSFFPPRGRPIRRPLPPIIVDRFDGDDSVKIHPFLRPLPPVIVDHYEGDNVILSPFSPPLPPVMVDRFEGDNVILRPFPGFPPLPPVIVDRYEGDRLKFGVKRPTRRPFCKPGRCRTPSGAIY